MSLAPRVVLIAGGSASGKSTVSRALMRGLGPRGALLLHDRYYKTPPAGSDLASWNFDHPDSLDTELLVAHVDALLAGQTVQLPRYDFSRHDRAEGTDPVAPTEYIVVEGILVLTSEALRGRAHHRVFVDAPADVRLARRLRRDVAERGRAPLGVLDQYLATVRPMHQAFVEPSRHYADVVLDGTLAVDQLVMELTRSLMA
ncbi:MAG: uridine kinase [Myxococcota bacterium]